MIIPPLTTIALLNKEDDDINKMKEFDDNYFKENNKYLYWNTLFMASRIKTAMEEENNYLLPTKWNTLWYSLRLKFTNDIIRKEAIEFLNGNFNYTKEIYGYKIYDIMKEYGLCYPVALLQIYSLVNNKKDKSGYTLERKVIDYHVSLQVKNKIIHSKLNKNGTIEYLVPEYKEKSQEELNLEYEQLKTIVEKERNERRNNPLQKRRFEQ